MQRCRVQRCRVQGYGCPSSALALPLCLQSGGLAYRGPGHRHCPTGLFLVLPDVGAEMGLLPALSCPLSCGAGFACPHCGSQAIKEGQSPHKHGATETPRSLVPSRFPHWLYLHSIAFNLQPGPPWKPLQFLGALLGFPEYLMLFLNPGGDLGLLQHALSDAAAQGGIKACVSCQAQGVTNLQPLVLRKKEILYIFSFAC